MWSVSTVHALDGLRAALRRIDSTEGALLDRRFERDLAAACANFSNAAAIDGRNHALFAAPAPTLHYDTTEMDADIAEYV